MKTLRNAWSVGCEPHGYNRWEEFLEKGIIAIGWPGIGSLKGHSKNEVSLKLRISPKYGMEYRDKPDKLAEKVADINKLINVINKGDVVIMIKPGVEEKAYIGLVKSGYRYDQELDDYYDRDSGYPHQRQVEWKEECNLDRLSEDLQKELAGDFIKELDDFVEELLDIITPVEEKKGMSIEPEKEEVGLLDEEAGRGNIIFHYPLSEGRIVEISLPKDITGSEIDSIASFISSFTRIE